MKMGVIKKTAAGGDKPLEAPSKNKTSPDTSTTFSGSSRELVAALERGEGSVSETAHCEFYSMMLAAGREDLVSSEFTFSSDDPKQGGASDNSSLEKEKLKALRQKDLEKSQSSEFYSMMLAVGREDLVSSEFTFSSDDPKQGVASDSSSLEKEKLKALRQKDLEEKSQSTKTCTKKATGKSASQNDEEVLEIAVEKHSSKLAKEKRTQLKQSSSASNLNRRISGLSQADMKRAATSEALGTEAPGAYDEAPGRDSIRREQSSLVGQSASTLATSSGFLSLGDLSVHSEEEKEEELDSSEQNEISEDKGVAGDIFRQDLKQAMTDDSASECKRSTTSKADDRDPETNEYGDVEAPISLAGLDSIPHSNLVEAHTVEEMVEVQAKPMERWTPKRISMLVLGTLVLVVIIIVAAITLSLKNNSPNTPAPTSAPTLSPELRLRAIAEAVVAESEEDFGTDIALLEDPSSPQSMALEWLAQEDPLRVPEEDVEHVRQRYSLAVLYFSTGGKANWTEQYEFLLPTHECTWSGALQCQEDTVIGVDLTDNNLLGRLPPELGMLSELRSIAMDDNQLTGPLPSILPPNLRQLDIWNNDLEGSIPALYATNLTQLESFRVGKNKLNGTIPAELGDLTQLTALSLESNLLTGSIPEIWNLTRMRDFQIGQQSLTGTLSPLVGRWTNTTVFHANKMNGLTGTIPTEFGLLTKLTSLKFSQNHLRGTFPSELGNLQKASLIAISRNGLNGTLPTDMARLTNLQQLYIQNTWMTGDMDYICAVKEEGGLPLLKTFSADMEEVRCECCTCCEY